MNDPYVMEIANEFGQRIATSPELKTDADRRRLIFQQIIGRTPNPHETMLMDQFFSNAKHRIDASTQTRARITNQIADYKNQISGILSPERAKIRAAKSKENSKPTGLAPFAAWDFTVGLSDTVGQLHCRLNGDAQIASDGLVLKGMGYASTPPISQSIREKTMEVWLAMNNLEQRGGGAITLQDLEGNTFDSIVYGEMKSKHWLAGSDFFNRTQDLQGPPESANGEPVCLTFRYDNDGTIAAFRNGKPYGKPYRKSQAIEFEADKAQFLFGMRHGKSANRGRMLSGKILEARFYNRALSAAEIMASANRQIFVGRQELLKALTRPNLKKLLTLERKLKQLETDLIELGPELETSNVWTQLAHSLFNLKEFIYIR